MIVHSLVFTCLDAGDGDVTETERDESPPLAADVTAGCPPGILQVRGPAPPDHGSPGLRDRGVHGQGAWTTGPCVETGAHTCLITIKAGKKQKTKKTDN